MKLVECSAIKLRILAGKKKIIFFGGGDNLLRMLSEYKEYQFEKKTAFIVDNNKSKVGTKIRINDTDIEIKAFSSIETIELNKYIFVITSLAYSDIFLQIQNMLNYPKGTCYRTPNNKYINTGTIVKLVSKLPLKNIIVLNGQGDTCENAQAIGKYIARNKYFNNKYKLVWLCDNPKEFADSKKEIYINRGAMIQANTTKELLRYYFIVGRAKYIIFENQMIPKIRNEQITVYLNHGAPPLKSTKGIIMLPQDLNYAVSPSKYSTNIVSEQYSVDINRVIECGSPRTDVLFERGSRQVVQKLTDNWKYDKVILWVPTFRQHKNSNRVDSGMIYKLGIPVIKSEQEFIEFIQVLERENILVILKPHLYQDLKYLRFAESKYFKVVTQEMLYKWNANVYDLMKEANAMLTDYSTIAFDFMLLDKIIGYTLDDIDEYKLGFSVDNVTHLMPGEKITSFKELEQYVEHVKNNKDVFLMQRKEICSLVHDYPDGYNSERICKLLDIGI